MTIKEFWESKEELAIHCHTEEEAIKLLDKFDKLGKKWIRGCDTYISARHYNYGDNTCYSNRGTYGTKRYYVKYNYTILNFKDLDDFKQDKQKEITMKEENKTKHKFKVGDKVRVRKDLEIKTYKKNEGSAIYVTNEMLKYRGQVFTIDSISKHGYYRFNENRYWWSDEMLEPVSKSSILDDVEFDYLWNIIKPFKDRIEYIKKRTLDRQYYISIASKDTFTHIPPFPKDSPMYKGMEADREYTLEALGFVEPKPQKLNCRVVCIESDGTYFITVGKIYEFKDGYITFDNGAATAYSYESIEEFNKHNSYCKLLQIKE